MGLGEEWMADHMFEYMLEPSFGLPGDTWTTADGRKIKLTDMTDRHITNCMKLVVKDDGWYAMFEIELEKRKNAGGINGF